MTLETLAGRRWTRAERLRLSGVVGAVVALNLAGWSLYLYYRGNLYHPGDLNNGGDLNHGGNLSAAANFGAAGTLAYVLGIRHAFDADHIAAIDDTTRLMLARGRRPLGVGFFFAIGHSAVVLALALVVAFAARTAATAHLDRLAHAGGLVAAAVAVTFLSLVAVLNTTVLSGLLRLWRRLGRGEVDSAAIDRELVNRGLMNRMLGRRAYALIRSSWHMLAVGVLFGLGLETASEVTLLSLQASTASTGPLPALAVLTLPLLFAAGMSALDTADSLVMTRAYSWAYRHPGRRLYYNLATTGMTVLVALFVASVYAANLLVRIAGVGGPVAGYASLADRFQLLGYLIVTAFGLAWVGAAVGWRLSGARRGAAGSRA